jgi:hypothetical protein
LANGEINSFLGFNFIVSNRLSLSGSTRSCIAYAQDEHWCYSYGRSESC